MKTNYFRTTAQSAAFAAALACGINLRAATASMPQTLNDGIAGPAQFQTVDFSEMRALTRAYLILATGDHDYKGHRVKSMRQIEDAAKLLGVRLGGDAKDRQKQALSDEKLKEARGLLETVLGAAEVRTQPRIAKHVTEAIHQLNIALTIR